MIGRIYKIICKLSNDIYIGSTFNKLNKRLRQHKDDYGKYLNGKGTEIAVYPYFKQYGMENFKIVLIKEYEVLDRQHLEIYETLSISKLKSCNKNNPFALPLKKHYMMLYREKNKEKLSNLNKEWRKNNMEENKLKRSRKVECECGTTYSHNDKARHLRSQKHQKFIIDGIRIEYKLPAGY